jgi:hypothetical protein
MMSHRCEIEGEVLYPADLYDALAAEVVDSEVPEPIREIVCEAIKYYISNLEGRLSKTGRRYRDNTRRIETQLWLARVSQAYFPELLWNCVDGNDLGPCS